MYPNFFMSDEFPSFSFSLDVSLEVEMRLKKINKVLDEGQLKIENLALQAKLDMMCEILAEKETVVMFSLRYYMKNHSDETCLILSFLDVTAKVNGPTITQNLREKLDRHGLFPLPHFSSNMPDNEEALNETDSTRILSSLPR